MWFNEGAETQDEDLHVVGPTSLDSVDCQRFEAKGATEIAGDLVADVAACAGATEIGGNVSVRTFESEGATEVCGSFDAVEARCEGATEVVGRTQVEDLHAKGASEFGDVESDSFTAKGATAADRVLADEISIQGVTSAERLEAGAITVLLDGDTSTIETIVADDVKIERAEDADGQSDLKATTIDGDTVAVEHATVETVVGRDVRIGPGSNVELVRADDLSIHSDATVERTEPLG